MKLWRRIASRFSGTFGRRPLSGVETAGQRSSVGHTSLLIAGARAGKPDEIVAEFVAAILRAEQSTLLLSNNDRNFCPTNAKYHLITTGSITDRGTLFEKISSLLKDRQIPQILSVPGASVDLLNAIAASDITGAPLALCIAENYDIPTADADVHLLGEALRKARLCVAASEPMRAELQKRFGKKVWIIPPLASAGDSANKQEGFAMQRCAELIKWISESLQAGVAIDDRYEKMYSDLRDRLTPYVDPPAPPDIHWEMEGHYHALYRLRAAGFKPDFVVDVGASTGYWSHIATKLFPCSRYFLIEPLLEKYLETEGAIYQLHPSS